MNYYLESIENVFADLESSPEGLTSSEAEKRLKSEGRNELTEAPKKSLFVRFMLQLVNPMVLVLLAAAAASLLIAILEHGTMSEYAEAGIILAVVVLNGVLGVVQESKAEKAIEALKGMSTSVATVKRDGQIKEIPSTELVRGDIIMLDAGDSVPADVRLTFAASLKIEEAALTGESVPSEKFSNTLHGGESGKIPLGDRKNMAYTGSGIAYGRGEGVVTATGMNSEIGKIAKFIQSAEEGQTPLQKRLSSLSKILSFIVLGICIVIFVVRLLGASAINAESITTSFMLAISLAVAAIPEGLAAVVTIVLSIGVTNMAKRRAIIRKLTAVETLGCAQVICSDKTGTLTQNKMTVVQYYGEKELLVRGMALCCDSKLVDGTIIGDPTENALIAYAMHEGVEINQLLADNPRVGEAPFDSVRKMMSTVHKTEEGIVQYTKGAADEVLKVCDSAIVGGKTVPLTQEVVEAILAKNQEYADNALRVLACAYKTHQSSPADYAPEKIEKGLTFIGLEAMTDPVRPEVKAAIGSCRTSGIRVVMITGDHKTTAAAIAKELGIISSADEAVTGHELDEISEEDFEKRIEHIFVYARVQPEHKVRIVNMWRKKGFVTAMTGDGVNDAPAIKSSDIGVGMGITGTDVTKNVADMVLADDNFATIVSAVEEGRRIFDNIKKTIQFLLSSNLSEVVSILVATIAGFVLFKPVHLLFINLVTDSLPAVALGMEEAQDNIMKKPPRGQSESIFAGGLGINVIYQGILIAGITLAAYFVVGAKASHDIAMTAAFFTMSMCEIFHAYNMRTEQSVFKLKKHNKVLFGAMALSLVLTLTIIYVPFLAAVFSLEPLSLSQLFVSLILAATIIPLVEVGKILTKTHKKSS